MASWQAAIHVESAWRRQPQQLGGGAEQRHQGGTRRPKTSPLMAGLSRQGIFLPSNLNESEPEAGSEAPTRGSGRRLAGASRNWRARGQLEQRATGTEGEDEGHAAVMR